METESLEDGLLAAKSSVKLRDVTPSDSKATPTVVLSSMVALCASLTIGCSVSTTNFHGFTNTITKSFKFYVHSISI